MWSWILTAVGVTGFILAGRRVWWCWYVNIACQALWLAYALTTRQYGFIAGAVVYSVVFARNAVLWTREHRKPPELVHIKLPEPAGPGVWAHDPAAYGIVRTRTREGWPDEIDWHHPEDVIVKCPAGADPARLRTIEKEWLARFHASSLTIRVIDQ